ncbi:substrate-binding domain-containing protein [Arcicella aquatica]|uniref:Substrate-binding domain-containing protein n=1 Tax=Arcicella aquatica TaxID=217141 RepID=A0ABU5QK07_9BACT|nr:substrate-binding domain-containing protein [Arcicella aquatica]MEA5257388.1 substrate-binding domain-containing protein [Arcicella aquatica]
MTAQLANSHTSLQSKELKILIVFSRLNDFKHEIYDGFMDKIEGKATVDLYIHQFSTQNAFHFEKVIKEKINQYDYFAFMMHTSYLNEDFLKTINSVPTNKLIILEKRNEFIRGKYACVYQDFEQDIYEALFKAKEAILKYSTLNCIIQEHYANAYFVIEGLKKFAKENNLQYNIYSDIEENTIRSKEAYLILSERYLAETLMCCKNKKMVVGEDIGIVSYNETPIKEILSGGITVVSTDHFQLGKNAADLILSGRQEHIRNSFLFIRRNSL